MNLQELQITRTTEKSTGRYVYAITKTNNTSYSPTTIISTKIPATQMAYKKTYTKTQIDTKKDTNTDTDTDKTQRQRKKKTRTRHSGQE